MSPVNDVMEPLLQLDGIAVHKMREKVHTAVLRASVPGLERPYERLLQDWEIVFGRTLELVQSGMRGILSGAGEYAPPDWRGVPKLLDESRAQSREFIRQLGLLEEQSTAVSGSPSAKALIAHIRGGFGTISDHEENDSPEGYGGPQPADGPLRPEGTWSNPTWVAGNKSLAAAPVPIGGHHLPPLPYPYNALEPWIDEQTMRIHHDKHHQTYVDGLNKAEKKLEEVRKTGDFELVKHWERELAFHGAGHFLHTIFWEAMAPKGGGRPSGPLAAEIDRSFGSFESFRAQFSEAANRLEGNGWSILVWSPRSRRLEILTAEKHQNLSQWDVIPLLPLDVWEHAYYLKHQNNRPAYVKDWWNVVNWPYVAQRFANARTLQWTPY